jgi:hypothetical protein
VIFLAVIGSVIFPQLAKGDIFAYTDLTPGFQTGYPGILLANIFNQPIDVTSLGALVNNPSTGLADNNSIAIVNSTGSAVPETTFGAGPLVTMATPAQNALPR